MRKVNNEEALYLSSLLLLPVLLTAGVFENLGFQHLGTMLPFSTAYRLRNEIYSAYQEDQSLLPTERANMHYSQSYPTRIDSITVNYCDSDGFYLPATGMTLAYSYNAAGMVESTDVYSVLNNVWEKRLMLTAEYDSQNRLVRLFLYGAYYDDFGNLTPHIRRHIVYGAGSTFEIYDWDGYWNEYLTFLTCARLYLAIR